MEKEVLISVLGLQSQGEDSDNIELITEGKIITDGDGLHLSYEESELTGLEGTTTLFHVEPRKVTLLRIGSVNSEMIFELGKRHISLYDTPFGSMEISVTARRINSTLAYENGGTLEIDYDIEINHMHAGQNFFRINVREAMADDT